MDGRDTSSPRCGIRRALLRFAALSPNPLRIQQLPLRDPSSRRGAAAPLRSLWLYDVKRSGPAASGKRLQADVLAAATTDSTGRLGDCDRILLGIHRAQERRNP